MSNLLPLGFGAWAFISFYLLSLLLIGWYAKKSRKEDTLNDFYLAGNGLSLSVLFLTLFATQYSGNTFFGFTGATYRLGYTWILSIHFMTSIIVCYLIFAPKLHKLSKKENFLTPSDYIQYRFKYSNLSLIISIIGIIVLSNYLLAQLMAMGRALQGISGDSDGSIYYIMGVLVLAGIIVIYGTMGGLRAVAWTDAIQGVILLVGFSALLVMLFDKFGPLSKATEIIFKMDEANNTRKAAVPDAQTCRTWLSYIIILGGLSLYPQAIQRIYAAKSEKVLKKGLAVMAFMPIPTMIISVIAGIMALAYISGLEGAATDQIFGQVLREIQEYSIIGYGLSILILAAILAAMMSTADSALLTISSMFTKDIYTKFFNSIPKEATLTLVGKICSWCFLTLMIIFAILLKEDTSLVKLMDRKLDLMIQVSPAFMLGIHFKWLRAKPVFWGIICGVIVALSIPYLDLSCISKGKVYGFHAGLVGLIPNLIIVLVGSYFIKEKT